MRLERIILPLMAVLLALVAAMAPAIASHITPRLIAETMVPAAGGETTLAFAMDPAPGWHGYWRNPGDAGVATRVEWQAPAGLRLGPLTYPVPQTLMISGLMNYVYEGPHALLVALRVPAGLRAGTALPIVAKLSWLACNPQTCVPERAVLALTLRVGNGAVDPAVRATFDRWRAALPRPLGLVAHFQLVGGRFRLAVPLPAAAAAPDPYFFAATDHVIAYAAPQTMRRAGNRLVIETAAAPDAAHLPKVEGVLRLADGRGLSLTALPGAVPAVAALAARTDSAGDGLLLAFGGALLGGLLLNVMPCVFPILSLKALSLARAGESARAARIEALAYAAGVVLVCAGLGAALLALRAGGSAAGWAFQLQDPRMILLLMLLVTGIALNLAGLFELPGFGAGERLAASGGTAGAFWTGALAAFVATPCTGPFMGVALGAALVLPPLAAELVFVGLGLGLALPFLALGFVPALRACLPRPGAWMDRLRHILSLPMFATALGLCWVLGRQAGSDGLTLGLAAALVMALGLWWIGVRQRAGRGGNWLPLMPALVAAIGIVVAVPRLAPPATSAANGAIPFSPTRLAALRAEGRPVFLYFTADWCLTCKVNEATAIDRPEVARRFAAARVAVMAGDWTRGDAGITRFLAAHGRSGVPFYLFYPAGGGAPRALPQLLTPSLLTALA